MHLVMPYWNAWSPCGSSRWHQCLGYVGRCWDCSTQGLVHELKLDLDVNLLILDSFPRNHGWFQVTPTPILWQTGAKTSGTTSTNNLFWAKVLFGYCQGSFAQHWLHKRPLSIRYRLYKDYPEAGVMKLRDLFSFFFVVTWHDIACIYSISFYKWLVRFDEYL